MARVGRLWNGCARDSSRSRTSTGILGGAEFDSLVDAGLYLRSVTDAVVASVGSDDRITVEAQATPCQLTTTQAATVGLITNEAMTNA